MRARRDSKRLTRLTSLIIGLVALTTAAEVGIVAPASAAPLPDGRAFELVSPPDLNGNGALQPLGGVTSVLSDDAVVWGGGLNSTGPSGSGANPTYLAVRGPGGWVSTSLLPDQIASGEQYNLLATTPAPFTAVFSVVPLTLNPPSAPPTQQVPTRLVYRDPVGGFTTFAQAPFASASIPNLDAISDDGQHIVFSSDLTPEGATRSDGLHTTYEWSPSTGAQAIGRAAGDPLEDCSEQSGAYTRGYAANAVSADGSTTFVQSGAGGSDCPPSSQLFVAVNGQTQEISIPTDGTPDPPANADASVFQGATPDGKVAYFTSTTPLTSNVNAGNELYKWETTPSGSRVTCVTCAVATENGVQYVRVSPNGQYLYFSVQDADGSTEKPYGLYVEHAGTVEKITATAFRAVQLSDTSQAQLSASGAVIAFADPSYPGPALGSAIYRAVVTDHGVSGPECVTCDLHGTDGAAALGVANGSPGSAGALSADGNLVVFQTPNALGTAVSSDQIYEWTPSAGDRFIADTNVPAAAGGNAAVTPDGHDIFFYSTAQLTSDVAQPDTAGLFDARVNGGFVTSPTTAVCSDSADNCQGASGAVSSASVSSASGCCGNLAAPKSSASVSVDRLSASALRTAARSGRLTFKVHVRGSGTLRLRLSARINGRERGIGTVRRPLFARTSDARRGVIVTVRISALARSALERAGHLSITRVATFPRARTAKSAFTLALPSRGTARRAQRTEKAGV